MSSKIAIIERIGEDGLLLPVVITRALAAHERVKYYLTLLQAVHAYATARREPAPNLRAQREASGVSDTSFDHIVEDSSTIGGHVLHVPHAASILERLFDELRLMLQPLAIAGRTQPDVRARFDVYQRRLDDLIAHVPSSHDDQIAIRTLRVLISLSGNGHDTAHHLAVDLHGELNRLQSSVSAETIDSARVYAIDEADRPLVRAFMRGINRTSHLKFAHPGLATTATRDAGRLSIQCDLGPANAHVIVIHVTELTAAITYTDVHRARVRFFQDLLRPYGVQWSSAPLPTGVEYEMSVGRFVTDTPESLQRYLAYLGSRLVFLLDWNRARKRLTRLVKKSEAIALLKWAADHEVGHHAFLQLGDLGLIDAALERAAPPHMRPGARLDEWLGADAAHVFLTSLLRTASTALKSGRSLSLIEDEIHAELLRNIQTPDPHVLQRAAEHAAIVSALAEQILRTISQTGNGGDGADASHTAELAKRWSTQADQIVFHSSRRYDRRAAERELRQLLTEADHAADALEESAFMLTLLPKTVDPQTLSLLASLAGLVTDMVREYVRCLEQGRRLSPAYPTPDVDAILVAIDRLVELNREANAKKRVLTERLLRGPGDFHDLHVVGGMARGFEQTATSLSRCGAIVRDHLLNAPARR